MKIAPEKQAEILLNKSFNEKTNKFIYKKVGSRKVFAFIGKNKYGFYYAFGSPSQIGGYIAFNKPTFKECEKEVFKQFNN